MNAHHYDVNFVLPAHAADEYWQVAIDTQVQRPKKRWLPEGFEYRLDGRSMAVLELKRVRPQTLAKVAKWFKIEDNPEPEAPNLRVARVGEDDEEAA